MSPSATFSFATPFAFAPGSATTPSATFTPSLPFASFAFAPVTIMGSLLSSMQPTVQSEISTDSLYRKLISIKATKRSTKWIPRPEGSMSNRATTWSILSLLGCMLQYNQYYGINACSAYSSILSLLPPPEGSQ